METWNIETLKDGDILYMSGMENLETWKLWRHGNFETWKHGDVETWIHGDFETREIQRLGDVETWKRLGNVETWT